MGDGGHLAKHKRVHKRAFFFADTGIDSVALGLSRIGEAEGGARNGQASVRSGA